jgi:Mg2+ and Co2+ transporter CorA
MLPLTLVTGIFGMNTDEWHFNDWIILFSFIGMTLFMFILTMILRKKKII